MNTNTIICFDFETVAKITRVKGRINADTVEPVQLAAVAIDPVTMDLCKWGGVFDSMMCPEGDWKDRVDPGALRVNKLRVEDIAAAPPRKDVWLAFSEWVMQFNPKGKQLALTNPIPAGKNIRHFDCPIVESLSEKYGTSDEKGLQKLFHRRRGSMWGWILDVEDDLFRWFSGPDGDIENYTMDVVRDYVGLSQDGAHSAIVDAHQTAELLCRFMRLYRKMFKQIPFKGSMRDYRVPAKTGHRPQGVGPRGDQLERPVLLEENGSEARMAT